MNLIILSQRGWWLVAGGGLDPPLHLKERIKIEGDVCNRYTIGYCVPMHTAHVRQYTDLTCSGMQPFPFRYRSRLHLAPHYAVIYCAGDNGTLNFGFVIQRRRWKYHWWWDAKSTARTEDSKVQRPAGAGAFIWKLASSAVSVNQSGQFQRCVVEVYTEWRFSFRARYQSYISLPGYLPASVFRSCWLQLWVTTASVGWDRSAMREGNTYRHTSNPRFMYNLNSRGWAYGLNKNKNQWK